jgi:hypothetical protein
MKIIISERQLDKILGDPDILNEQNDATNDQRTLIVLQNKINDIIDKKEKEILDQSSIKIIGNAQAIQLQIGTKPYNMKLQVPGIYSLIIPPKSMLSFTGTQMSTLLPEIEKIPEYKTLVERYPELKTQIQNGGVKGSIYTDDQNQGVFKFTVTKKLLDMKDAKGAVAFGTEYPLGEFLERNKLIYKFKNGLYGTLESGQISMNLSAIPLRLSTATTPTPEQPVAISTMALGDLFTYNDVSFKDPNIVDQQLGKFVQEVKDAAAKYGQPFIDHFKQQSPTVLGYSSIDGDPNQAIVGEYKPCAGNKTRRDYDLCLSTERAKVIADELNKRLPELGNAIKSKGMGETTQFGPGWTKESPTVPEKTAPNRRYVLSPIKPFMGKPTAEHAKQVTAPPPVA